jgi:hypothetical protein
MVRLEFWWLMLLLLLLLRLRKTHVVILMNEPKIIARWQQNARI